MIKAYVKPWLQSAAGKVSLFLISACIVMLLITMSSYEVPHCINCSSDMMNNVLVGIATNLIGIVVTISFVQYFLDKQDESNKRKEEVEKIKRYNRYIQTLIQRYLMFYIAITTKIADRNKVDVKRAFEHSFELADMSDMYKPSLYISDGLIEPSIVLFYKAEEKLCNFMMEMVKNIDFKYNEDLYKILEEFLMKSTMYDVRGTILGNMNLQGKEKRKRFSDIMADDLANEMHDWLGKFKRNELIGNAIYPYVLLYYGIREQIQLIKRYNNYINQI
ncbi:MAG: hypothetical protein E7202_13025 [Selenomonas ruminantium]|jgi:hypothetical protein|nr:hypothetical protein [Selenomonas ruminantium]